MSGLCSDLARYSIFFISLAVVMNHFTKLPLLSKTPSVILGEVTFLCVVRKSKFSFQHNYHQMRRQVRQMCSWITIMKAHKILKKKFPARMIFWLRASIAFVHVQIRVRKNSQWECQIFSIPSSLCIQPLIGWIQVFNLWKRKRHVRFFLRVVTILKMFLLLVIWSKSWMLLKTKKCVLEAYLGSRFTFFRKYLQRL